MLVPVIGVKDWQRSGNRVIKYSPIDNSKVCDFEEPASSAVNSVVDVAVRAHREWSKVPIPKREELLIKLRDEFVANKARLADLIQLEVGKIRTEALGEVQEAIDMLTFCVGLTRNLGGTIFPSEREGHLLLERWHPLGVVGIISAFNFPVAVWAWNAFLAVTCGNSTIWKPSELAPLSSFFACSLANKVAESFGFSGLFNLVLGGKELGKALAANTKVSLVSATGSVEMGKEVAQICATRLCKVILELGGNNAVIIHNDCDLRLAADYCNFGVIGTSGQRCTSIRRLIVHEEIYRDFISMLIEKFKQVIIGDPRKPTTNMGPLISEASLRKYLNAIEKALSEGGKILYGGKVLDNMPSGLYVTPTLVELNTHINIVSEETFAPIVWCFKYKRLDEAINLQNSVPQGLSSACFSRSLDTAFRFLQESDCGLANINTSTSGAEIGLAFGGEKMTGGGREAGSDCWKYYMRRQSCVINWQGVYSLAQNVTFQ